MKQPVERRLAAILATRCRGLLAADGADEGGTHERLKAHLREVVDRNRWFADSPLEGTGFEPSVPLGRIGASNSAWIEFGRRLGLRIEHAISIDGGESATEGLLGGSS